MMTEEQLLREVSAYINDHIGTFHQKRLDSLQDFRLDQLIRRKNPYLLRAKNIATSGQIVQSMIDAFLSSQEETIFGDFMEGVAVFVNQQVYNGQKPPPNNPEGIDLIFRNGALLYIVSIKSGPNWGNSDQLKRMLSNFAQASETLKLQHPGLEIVPVNGCIYGQDAKPRKNKAGTIYYKLCGQDFWRFVSGSDHLYTEIIEPLGHQAKQRNDAFNEIYYNQVNRFTTEFGLKYCLPNGAINWNLLVELSCKRGKSTAYPFSEEMP